MLAVGWRWVGYSSASMVKIACRLAGGQRKRASPVGPALVTVARRRREGLPTPPPWLWSRVAVLASTVVQRTKKSPRRQPVSGGKVGGIEATEATPVGWQVRGGNSQAGHYSNLDRGGPALALLSRHAAALAFCVGRLPGRRLYLIHHAQQHGAGLHLVHQDQAGQFQQLVV